MNIIFLDVDGVLNSERSFIAGSVRLKKYLCAGDPYYRKITKCTIDPIAVDLINHLCTEFDAKIVISSTHRCHFEDNFYKLESMREYFYYLGIDAANIIGWTPRSHTIRGEEIDSWLSDCNIEISNYAIIDDSSDMRPDQTDHLVLCDGRYGFSAENYAQVSKIFGKNAC